MSRRVLIAHGVKRHPVGIDRSGRAVWRMPRGALSRARVCDFERAVSRRVLIAHGVEKQHPFGIRKRDLDPPHASRSSMLTATWRCKGPVCFPRKLCGQKWFVTDVRPRNYIITSLQSRITSRIKIMHFYNYHDDQINVLEDLWKFLVPDNPNQVVKSFVSEQKFPRTEVPTC